MDRVERSVRRADSRGDPGAGSRPRESESPRQRDRARPSARSDRRGAYRDTHARAEAAQEEVRNGHDVHRDGDGRGGDIRSAVAPLAYARASSLTNRGKPSTVSLRNLPSPMDVTYWGSSVLRRLQA